MGRKRSPEKLAKRGHRARDLDLSEAGIDEADYVIATFGV